MVAEPGREPQLRVAVARGGVDVVHAVLEQQRERLVRLLLRDRAERRGAEDDAGAVVAGRSERCPGDHRDSLRPVSVRPAETRL